jgi:phosphohistidine phosphatase SixA
MMRFLLPLLLLFAPAGPAKAEEAVWAALNRGGHVLLMRHAAAPGVGDPSGFRLEDCATQRNLSQEGRRQAAAFGAELRRRGVPVDRVLTSGWCRAKDTAALLGMGSAELDPALNSLFGRSEGRDTQTAALRRAVAGWRGPGTLVMVTHQVNITALTGIHPASGEAVLLKPGQDGFEIVGRLPAGLG